MLHPDQTAYHWVPNTKRNFLLVEKDGFQFGMAECASSPRELPGEFFIEVFNFKSSLEIHVILGETDLSPAEAQLLL